MLFSTAYVTHQFSIVRCKCSVVSHTGSCNEDIPYSVYDLLLKLANTLLPAYLLIT